MKKLLPILIVGVTAMLIVALTILSPEPEAVAPERPVTQVEVLLAELSSTTLNLRSQGTVLPEIETNLAVEVAGRIIEVAPSFRPGGRFAAGEWLFRIDPADYEAALAARRAELADAELALAQESALAEQAAADWATAGTGTPSDLVLRRPQLASAHARLASAEASVKKAERDLARTEVRAPYEGAVLSVQADLGQYVMANPADPVARIYATAAAEIRLPIRIEEVDFLIDPATAPSPVTLFRESGGDRRTWAATLVRFESTIEPQSRLLYAVARVNYPEQLGLRRGLFVTADISGRQIDDVFILPRYVLRGTDTVYIVTEEEQLISRTVEVLKTDATEVIISSGLAHGERIASSPIAYFAEGMPVAIITDQ